MAHIRKYKGGKRSDKLRKTASVLDRIQPLKFGHRPVVMALYGDTGTGKTTLCGKFPGPKLWILCSGGLKPTELYSLPPELEGEVDTLVVEESSDLEALTDSFRNRKKGSMRRYKTVVLDHVTGFQDLVLKEVLDLNEIPLQKNWGLAQQAEYGICTERCKEHLRRLLNIDTNLVIVAHERLFKANENDDAVDNDLINPKIGCNLMPKLAGWLNGAVPYLCQMFKAPKMEEKVNTIRKGGKKVKRVKMVPVPDKVEYCLRVGPSSLYQTKFRLPTRGEEMPDVIRNPDYDKIVEMLESRYGKLRHPRPE